MRAKKILTGLKIALQTELNGIQFYRLAAKNTKDPKAKKVFRMLADDEIKHYQEIERSYRELTQLQRWPETLTLGTIEKIFKGKSPIFSASFKKRIKDKHFEMSALSIGALLETDSIDFYRRMFNQVKDKNGRTLFKKLIDWERKHLEAITNQMEIIKEDYWAKQGFAPLF